MSTRLSRFLINRVDKRLADIEKEKKFDIIMIVAGICVLLLGVSLVIFRNETSRMAVFFGVIAMMIGIALIITMTKEYIADCKKAKSAETTKTE